MTKMAVCTLASHRRSRTKSRRTEVDCTRSRTFIMQLLALAAVDSGANIHDRSENIDRVAAAIERALFTVSSGALDPVRSFRDTDACRHQNLEATGLTGGRK
jgi:hypothetical protein